MSKEPKKEEKKSEPKDTTKGHLNSKALPINYPKGSDEVVATLKKEQREIQLNFSDAQLILKAKKAAKLSQEITALETEKKAKADELGTVIKAKEVEAEILMQEITQGFETKPVLCDIVRNFTKGIREYFHLDKKVGEEKLRASDHQLELDAAEDKNKTTMKVVKIELGKLKAGDCVITAKGKYVELTADDLLTLKAGSIERYATGVEIEEHSKTKKKK